MSMDSAIRSYGKGKHIRPNAKIEIGGIDDDLNSRIYDPADTVIVTGKNSGSL